MMRLAGMENIYRTPYVGSMTSGIMVGTRNAPLPKQFHLGHSPGMVKATQAKFFLPRVKVSTFPISLT